MPSQAIISTVAYLMVAYIIARTLTQIIAKNDPDNRLLWPLRMIMKGCAVAGVGGAVIIVGYRLLVIGLARRGIRLPW